MNSWVKPPETEQPFAVDAGVRASVPPPTDPYEALDDLMAVVEALCPKWPDRGPFVSSGKMLL